MALFQRQPKRTVPKPDLAGEHRSNNPLFPKPDEQQMASFRANVLWSFLGVLVIIGVGMAVYGPWLRVQAVTIKGTQALDPKSVKIVTNNLLDQRRWLVLPNRNTWVLSSRWLQDELQKQISQKLSIEGVVVQKEYPHSLTVTVRERIAAWRWSSAGQVGIVDLHGIVMSLPTTSDAALPLVVDQGNPLLSIDRGVVREEVVQALNTINQSILRHNIKVTKYIIPEPTCPTVLAPQPTTTFPSNTNSANVNSLPTNQNTNLAIINASVSNVNGDTNTSESPPCDLAQLHYNSQEIHLELDKGPQVYFDRHQNLEQAVQTLVAVLAHPTAPITKYIDLRFGQRVYIQ